MKKAHEKKHANLAVIVWALVMIIGLIIVVVDAVLHPGNGSSFPLRPAGLCFAIIFGIPGGLILGRAITSGFDE